MNKNNLTQQFRKLNWDVDLARHDGLVTVRGKTIPQVEVTVPEGMNAVVAWDVALKEFADNPENRPHFEEWMMAEIQQKQKDLYRAHFDKEYDERASAEFEKWNAERVAALGYDRQKYTGYLGSFSRWVCMKHQEKMAIELNGARGEAAELDGFPFRKPSGNPRPFNDRDESVIC